VEKLQKLGCSVDPYLESYSNEVTVLPTIKYSHIYDFIGNHTVDGNDPQRAFKSLDGYRMVVSSGWMGGLCVKKWPHGTMINKKFPFLGASPDGIVNCSCHGKHLVEVKCPYRCCTKGLQEAAKDPSFFLKDNEGTLGLDTSHAYYYQVQCQLGISKVENVTLLFGTQKVCT